MNILEQLEKLADEWENMPYTVDLTSAVYANCARKLRDIIGDNPFDEIDLDEAEHKINLDYDVG